MYNLFITPHNSKPRAAIAATAPPLAVITLLPPLDGSGLLVELDGAADEEYREAAVVLPGARHSQLYNSLNRAAHSSSAHLEAASDVVLNEAVPDTLAIVQVMPSITCARNVSSAQVAFVWPSEVNHERPAWAFEAGLAPAPASWYHAEETM